MKISAFGGYQVIRKGRRLKPVDESLSVAALFRYQDLITQLDIGVYWYKNPLVFGMWYRGLPIINEESRGDALIFLVGYKIDQFSVGYSYDFTISKLVATSGGAHEVSITWEFKTTRQRRTARMVPCPEF